MYSVSGLEQVIFLNFFKICQVFLFFGLIKTFYVNLGACNFEN